MNKYIIQIRKGIFETNSSQTHMLTLFSEEHWKKYNNGELLRKNTYEREKFITKEDAIEQLNKNILKGIEKLKEEQDKPSEKDYIKLLEEGYNKLDKSNYNDLVKFIKSHKTHKFCLPIPMDKQTYRDRFEELEYDNGSKEIDGKKVYYEVLHGREG